MRLHFASQAQSAFNWIDDLRLDLHAGIEPANLIVKNLADECGMTKDAAGHGHWDGRGGSSGVRRRRPVGREQAADHDRRQMSEFGAGGGENLRRRIFRAGEHGGKERGEVWSGARSRGAGEIFERSDTPGFQQSRGKGRILQRGAGFGVSFSSIHVTHQSGGCGATDPVSGAFIGDGESPASGARGVALRIAAVGDGAGAGDDEDARTRAECGFQGDLHVADDVNWRRQDFGEDAANGFGNFGARGSGGADACMGHLRRGDSCGSAGLADGLMQGLAGLRFADAEDVAGSGGCGREKF